MLKNTQLKQKTAEKEGKKEQKSDETNRKVIARWQP